MSSRKGLSDGWHCYVASEALYHLLCGSAKPMHMKVHDLNHWFLLVDGVVIDITADQFDSPVDYECARGKGFLTKEPSKRCQELMRRVISHTGSTHHKTH